MKIYKVGGAVRDKILGHEAVDIDYVVVGSSVQEMLDLDFIPVGKHFPVFLHPITHAEYALARCERKTGIGYHEFQFDISSHVSLEDDLARRDITINAIAEDEAGKLIDPFGGISDIHNHTIRHVSNAFIEDPLRVLRVARFRARFNFTIAPETLELMQQIVKSNELQSLPKERIWAELKKALEFDAAYIFFEVLNQVGALAIVLPEFTPIFVNHEDSRKFKYLLEYFNSKAYVEHLKFMEPLNTEEKLILIYYFLTQSPTVRDMKIVTQSLLTSNSKSILKLILKCYSNLKDDRIFEDVEFVYKLIINLDPLRQKDRFNQFIRLARFIDLVFSRSIHEITPTLMTPKFEHAIHLIINIINELAQIDYKLLTNDLDQRQIIVAVKSKKQQIIKNKLNQQAIIKDSL